MGMRVYIPKPGTLNPKPELNNQMILIGTVVNVVAVVAGSAIGLIVGSRLPKKIVKSVFNAMGLFTLFLGFYMALKGQQFLVMVFSLIIGTITGEVLSLESKYLT